MKVRLRTFNDNGETLNLQSLDLYICSSEEPPILEINLPVKTTTISQSIEIPLNELQRRINEHYEKLRRHANQ